MSHPAEVPTCWQQQFSWMPLSDGKAKYIKTKKNGRAEMEQLKFDYPLAKRGVTHRAHVGVVGSGDMEILMEPSETGAAHVSVQTSVNGFSSSWKAVLDRFF